MDRKARLHSCFMFVPLICKQNKRCLKFRISGIATNKFIFSYSSDVKGDDILILMLKRSVIHIEYIAVLNINLVVMGYIY